MIENDLSAIVFPHSWLSEGSIKRALSFFGSLKVCQPWFMDRLVPFSDRSGVQVLFPPVELKPSGDFSGLLAGYRRWVRTSHDKGFDAFLAFAEGKQGGEEATWEIRGELRHKESYPLVSSRKNPLKEHLILHLAQEIEQERRKAEELLRRLKEKDSPLRGAIEADEDSPGPLADLPEFNEDVSLPEANLNRVLEAWFSLFEEHVQSDEILLTLSRGVFQGLYEDWEEWGGKNTSTQIEFQYPDLSDLPLDELLRMKDRFLEKNMGMKKAAVEFCRGNTLRLSEAIHYIDHGDFPGRRITVILRHFASHSLSGGKETLRHLSGKTLGLITEAHPYGS
jgi:hypothetical protein